MERCNADVGHPCDARNGEPCLSCAAWLAETEAAARMEWDAASPEQRHPKRCGFETREEAEEAMLRDAGRRP